MTVKKKICKFEKFGYCKLKDECKDYHPTEICSLQICNVGKCLKRHPKPCKYFKSGNCRFKESCKYEHQEEINTKELLDRIIKLENELNNQINTKGLNDRVVELENENLKIKKMYENLADTTLLLQKNLSHLQKEYVLVLNHAINKTQEDDQVKLEEDTIVCDDKETNLEQGTLVNNDQVHNSEIITKNENYSTEVFKEEIKFCIDIETKVNQFEKLIENETNENAKQMFQKFQIDLYKYFEYECLDDDNISDGQNDIFLGRKGIELQKLLKKFDRQCTSIFISTFTNTDYKSLIMEKLKTFICELVRIKNLKLTN